MPETMMKMPALAVMGTDHRIVRSTESFRQRYKAAQSVCEKSPELDRVLTGRADTAVVSVGDLSVEIEAVTDATGRRQAMLSLPLIELEADAEPPIAALRAAAEESQAMVWVKDLDGRYLYANPRYLRDLKTSEDRLYGNTDGDLPEDETVDGPRRRFAEDGLEEPLQLEYTVPSIDKRPALAAFRFALRDDKGKPIGTCGVAAPVAEAHVACDESVRLMQLERWNRLDPMDVRAEVLEQWHLQAAPPRVEVGLDGAGSQPELVVAADGAAEPGADRELTRQLAERADQLQGELSEAQARAKEAEAEVRELRSAVQVATEEAQRRRGELDQASSEVEQVRAEFDRASSEVEQVRAELEQARAELERAQAEAPAAQSEAEAARAQLDQTRDELDQAHSELDQAHSELDQARAELERAQAEAEAAHSDAEAARAELGAARAQTESLRGPSTAAMRLSEELGRALAGERERGDELERALARIRTRLNDFETALDSKVLVKPRAAA